MISIPTSFEVYCKSWMKMLKVEQRRPTHVKIESQPLWSATQLTQVTSVIQAQGVTYDKLKIISIKYEFRKHHNSRIQVEFCKKAIIDQRSGNPILLSSLRKWKRGAETSKSIETSNVDGGGSRSVSPGEGTLLKGPPSVAGLERDVRKKKLPLLANIMSSL